MMKDLAKGLLKCIHILFYLFIINLCTFYSTWTIDLCYLLKRFKIKHTYFTITFGVNPGYQDELFYEKIITKVTCKICILLGNFCITIFFYLG